MKDLVAILAQTNKKAQRTGASMNIQVTQEQYDFTCRLKREGVVASRSAYIRSLIERDMEQQRHGNKKAAESGKKWASFP